MRPTEAEWGQMKQYTNVAAAQRPANIRALFEKYSAWRAANAGWQNWNAQQFRQAVQGTTPTGQPPAPTPQTTTMPNQPAPGAGTSQNISGQGGVWWGGVFYDTPYKLRQALGFGKPNAEDRAKWQAWLAAHPTVAAWANSEPGGPGAEDPAGGDGGTGGEGGEGGGGGAPPEEGGGTTSPGITGPTDWSGVLGIAGLPPELMAQITDIFSRVTDTNAAIAMALGVVRGSAWYAQTFPGITAGIQKGLFQNEAGYRDYRNALDAVYRQYTGAPIDAANFQAAIGEGVSPDIVTRRFEAQAILAGYRPDLSFYSGAGGTQSDLGKGPEGTAFTEAEMLGYSQQQAGLGTVGGLGVKVERAFNLARQRMERAFEGTEASPQYALTNRGSLFTPSLGQPSASAQPDIGA